MAAVDTGRQDGKLIIFKKRIVPTTTTTTKKVYVPKRNGSVINDGVARAAHGCPIIIVRYIICATHAHRIRADHESIAADSGQRRPAEQVRRARSNGGNFGSRLTIQADQRNARAISELPAIERREVGRGKRTGGRPARQARHAGPGLIDARARPFIIDHKIRTLYMHRVLNQ